ncbi:MAG: 3-isopropylmalate dehydrogenase [Acidobacteriota bacterium]
MSSAKVVLLPGDGVGPEVTESGRRILEVVATSFDLTLQMESHPMGGCAIDAVGDPLPPETLEACQTADAILLGAVGGPQWSDPSLPVRPEQGILKLRSELGLFANLRPVPHFPALVEQAPLRPELLDGSDLLFVRELTGGIYFGAREEASEGDNASVAWDTMNYSASEVERVARVAFEAARGRRGKVTSVDKANVLASMRLWRQVVTRVAEDYPDVELEHLLVDACTMHLLTRPSSFDVIVAGNMFGDILSDEASVLAGSLGLLPSASLGDGTLGLYEPIHGSAPDIAGQGIANPLGTILSTAMLLRHSLGQEEAAATIEAAVNSTLDDGLRTRDLGGAPEAAVSTVAMTDAVLQRLGGPAEPN